MTRVCLNPQCRLFKAQQPALATLQHWTPSLHCRFSVWLPVLPLLIWFENITVHLLCLAVFCFLFFPEMKHRHCFSVWFTEWRKKCYVVAAHELLIPVHFLPQVDKKKKMWMILFSGCFKPFLKGGLCLVRYCKFMTWQANSTMAESPRWVSASQTERGRCGSRQHETQVSSFTSAQRLTDRGEEVDV